MKILYLTLKKEFFDMIALGVKREEYREIKPYWTKRLEYSPVAPFGFNPKEFDAVHFTNGYGSDKPTMLVKCKGICIDYTRPEWAGGWSDLVYVIQLGEILEIKNWNP